MQISYQSLAIKELGEGPEICFLRRFERRDARKISLGSYVLHKPKIRGHIIDHSRVADKAVARDDAFRPERSETLERFQPSVDGTHKRERCSPVEDDVAREDDAPLRKPDQDGVSGVRGPNRDEINAKVVAIQRHPVLERHARRGDFDFSPVDAREQSFRPETCFNAFLATLFVADYQRLAAEDEVAVRVVTVVVRVDQRLNGESTHGPYRVPERPRSPLSEAAIHRRDGLSADDKAGVIQAPAAIGLDVGVDVLT